MSKVKAFIFIILYARDTAMTNTQFSSILVSLCTLVMIGFSAVTQAEAQFGVGGGYNFKRESVMIE